MNSERGETTLHGQDEREGEGGALPLAGHTGLTDHQRRRCGLQMHTNGWDQVPCAEMVGLLDAKLRQITRMIAPSERFATLAKAYETRVRVILATRKGAPHCDMIIRGIYPRNQAPLEWLDRVDAS